MKIIVMDSANVRIEVLNVADHMLEDNRIVPFRARLFVEQHFLDGSTHRLCASAIP